MVFLIAGAAGFIGSNLSLSLLKKGHHVIGIDNYITGNKVNIYKLMEYNQFTFIREDICNIKNIDKPIDWILHFASPASPLQYMKYPIETMKANGNGTFNLLQIARRQNAKFLFASTSEIYGNPQMHPQEENYWGHVNPIGERSCYDESKRYAEALIYSMKRKYGISVRTIRIFNTYGPRMQLNDGRVITNFIRQILQNVPLSIFGSGSQTRCFQYIDDLVRGIEKVMESNYSGPINLGNTEEYSILEIAKLLSEICDHELKINYQELPPDDPERRKPNISVAKEVLQWQPEVSLKEGLKKTWNYFSANSN